MSPSQFELPCSNTQPCRSFRILFASCLTFLAYLAMPAAASPQVLVDCINSVHRPSSLTWQEAMAGKGSLRAVQAWWSDGPPRVPVTVVTHLTIDRLPQLLAQCKSWSGPLSAAVLLSLVQPQPGPLTPENQQIFDASVMRVDAFFKSIKAGGEFFCQLDLVLLYEVYADTKSSILYPLNTMRNMARLQARTSLVGFIDADLLISSTLYQKAKQLEFVQHISQRCQQKQAYVLPAFETIADTKEAAAIMADSIAHQSKENLIKMVAQGNAAAFDAKRFSVGHAATDFNRWYNAFEEYEINYVYKFEPWIIVDRQLPPWHDVQFRGYGEDKIIYIAALNAAGFKFTVQPEAFIVHRAHRESGARVQMSKDIKSAIQSRQFDPNALMNTNTDANNIFLFTWKLSASAKQRMDQGQYVPMLDAATIHCSKTLPWWR